MSNKTSLFIALILCLLFAGCQEVRLYSNLPEREVNEMVAILLANGIACTKLEGEEGMWSVSVEEERYAEAVAILTDRGRPRKQRPTMEELFPKTGFTSSPTEQRIRLTYGLEQSIESTIAALPGGIIDARVHLVLPDNQPLRESTHPSRANVVIIHQKGSSIENSLPTIKEIVIGGVDGLDIDSVSVELIESENSLLSDVGNRRSPQGPETTKILGIDIVKSSQVKFLVILGVAALSLIASIMLLLGRLFRRSPSST